MKFKVIVKKDPHTNLYHFEVIGMHIYETCLDYTQGIVLTQKALKEKAAQGKTPDQEFNSYFELQADSPHDW